MKGDFSRWQFDIGDNYSGVLAQQGRVLLDSDGVEQTRITVNWQDTAGRDIIGAGVAAVPDSAVQSFRVTQARVDAGRVLVSLEPGRVWADGLLVFEERPAPVERSATYLQPPIQDPPYDIGTIGAGVRDAVVLEVWREALNAFQIPAELIEPALGGPDTAERALTTSAIRLYRMGANDTCDSITGLLQDNFANKGRLTATLQPTSIVPGDCPVVEGGGYTGFEHNLYRIELARTTAAGTFFKWSKFNGGLVGRGVFDAANLRVNITANLQPIATSGLEQFYLEAEEFDEAAGNWRVTYGVTATLNSNQLVLDAATTFGTIPSSPNPVFFRLWNEIRDITEFPAGPNPVELSDGIRLEFEAPAVGRYTPGDYWTFQVRAGGIGNPETLIDNLPPEGIHYHRVVLAELNWDADQNITAEAGQIEDCRHIFPPLTRISTCCSFRVGDGVSSHGDFTSIQEAVDHLPAGGGEICVLPGTYNENVIIENRLNVSIHGCGPRSRIVSPPPSGEFTVAAPVIRVTDSREIRIESLAIEAHSTGIGVLLNGVGLDQSAAVAGQIPLLRDITLARLRISAATRAAIEAHQCQFVTIRECDIRMVDTPTEWPAIFFLGDDALLEHNDIRVRSGRQLDDGPTLPIASGSALGGLQIGGTSERVRVIDNLIQGGIGNGITLGSIIEVDPEGNDRGIIFGWIINPRDPCNPCKPGTVVVPPRPGGENQPPRQISAGALTDIRIERNRIYDMGLNGIGVVGFFDSSVSDEIITVERLSILGNHIARNLRRQIEAIPAAMNDRVGYGGIALADVENLIVWDNVIENNGPSQLEPVCGIFVLTGEGVDISRNRVLDNGQETTEPVASAKNGRRGGIVVIMAVAPTEPEIVLRRNVPVQNGVPALKVHDNIVSAPLGQALFARGLGAMSVLNNQFTTHGVFRGREQISDAFLASTVLLMNLGRSMELPQQIASFKGIREGQTGTFTGPALENGTLVSRRPAAAAVDTREAIIANGNILFANNQCVLNLIETGITLALSSIYILSLDDVAFENNQCDANLLDDLIYSQALIGGLSVRTIGNRFKEGLQNAFYSAFTLGIMNVTAHNVSTHCLLIFGLPNLTVRVPNVILLQAANPEICGGITNVIGNFGRTISRG